MKRDIKVWAYLSLQMFSSVYEIVSLFDACVFTTLLSSWWLDSSRPPSFCLGGKSTLYMTSDTSLFSLLAAWCVDFHCPPFSLCVFPGRCASFLFTVQSAGSHIVIVEWTWLIYFLFIFERLTDYDYDFIACFSSWIDYCLFFLSSLFILGCCWLIDLDMVGSFFLHPCLFLVWNFFPVLLWWRLFPNPLCSDVVCIVLLVNMNCFTLILSWNLFISFINFKK